MGNLMKYKGYWAEIKYSDEDECFYGIIDGLEKDSISFEGKSVKELKRDFKAAIDNYLLTCKQTNTIPEKQCKGSLNVRLGVELHNRVKKTSIEKNVSVNELIKRAIMAYLNTN